MARRYAANTQVSVEKSKYELDRLLSKHGASQRAIGHDEHAGRAVVAFRLHGKPVRLEMSIPTLASCRPARRDEEPRGWRGWTSQRRDHWVRRSCEQSQRQRWRALLLITKAKLEAIADGFSTVEHEFLADLVLPSGRRVEDEITSPLAVALEGQDVALLPGLERPEDRMH